MLFIMQLRYCVGVGIQTERGSGNALLMRHGGDLLHCRNTPRTKTRRIVFDPTSTSRCLLYICFMFHVLFYETCAPHSILYFRGTHLGDIHKVHDRM